MLRRALTRDPRYPFTALYRVISCIRVRIRGIGEHERERSPVILEIMEREMSKRREDDASTVPQNIENIDEVDGDERWDDGSEELSDDDENAASDDAEG